jgi:hypothetical protein
LFKFRIKGLENKKKAQFTLLLGHRSLHLLLFFLNHDIILHLQPANKCAFTPTYAASPLSTISWVGDVLLAQLVINALLTRHLNIYGVASFMLRPCTITPNRPLIWIGFYFISQSISTENPYMFFLIWINPV